MDKSDIIEKYINILGNDCVITDGDTMLKTKCIITQLWKRNKTVFEPKNTPIGLTRNDFFQLIIPHSCDISNMGSSADITINGKSYYFVKHEPFYVSDVLHYHFCVVKEIDEEESYVFK